ncbi:MAG: adenylate/guanylate cyclase domain-containing protein [Pseudomonadota bacterium]|nr:adenylate/guanylate cyclase domain-containing protein [Pseudomonadota bacterium]
MERRLAAILAADVVGYSRLMERDEASTLAVMKSRWSGVLEPLVGNHHGRIFKATGDGVLVEFASAVDAVNCAIDLQKSMTAANHGLPVDQHMVLRVGVNLGDVIVEGSDRYGDGVNIAARLEALASPGGICISGTVYEHVQRKLTVAVTDLGLQALKNIERPVRVLQVVTGVETAAPPEVHLHGNKPSIAVLPLVNLSSDPEQEYFADGITEDILTGLSRFRHLFVISRNSVMTYKGKAAKVPDIARELGVQYILEGSVRRSGNRVRVTVQLIDAEADRHLWAERYDRQIDDIFELQDELTRAIVAVLPGRMDAAVAERTKRKLPETMAAYECVLAGKVLHHRADRESNAEALRLLEKAIALEPKYAHAHAWKGCVLGQQWAWGWCNDRSATQALVVETLETALALDDSDSDVHRILAAISVIYRDLDKAVYHQEKALSLNPNDDLIVVQQGEVLTWLGRAEEGIPWIRKAMSLNPFHPARFWGHLGRACFVAGRYDEAIGAYRHVANPDVTARAIIAACHAQLGDSAAAHAEIAIILQAEPGFSAAAHTAGLPYRHESDWSRHRDLLKEAGLPE